MGIDERAKLLAIEQGIDEDKIVISGNPYHDWLSNWEPAVSKDNFISQIGLTNKNKRLLVYAPDPLSNINGKDIYGFDELSATLELVNLFDEHKIELKDWIVLVKAHPNQNREELNKLIHDHTIFKLLANDIDTNTCIYYADIVMGFFSSFLIEAAIMHKPVIRFFNKSIENDPIAELNIGTIVNKTTIISNLKSH
jgi:CDP-glycerol glycerophosphotransferase (TagB/SpsB family)